MGVNIGWLPYKPTKLNYISGGSNFHKYMEEAYGSFPILLSRVDIPVLKGMAVCGNDGAQELIDALSDYEKITVKAAW